MLLFRDGKSAWRQAEDSGRGGGCGGARNRPRCLLPKTTIQSLRPATCSANLDQVEVGSSLLVVGFPLGFHDTLNHMPVVRQAIIASSFGLALSGFGLFF